MVFKADSTALIVSEIVDISNSDTLSKVLASYLDTPSIGVIKEGKLAISGWILLRSSNPSVKILAGSDSFELNKVRPDVIKAILKTQPEESDQLQCGFLFEVDIEAVNSLELKFIINGEAVPWRRISLIDTGSDQYKAGAIFSRYVNNKAESISPEDIHFVETVASRGRGFMLETPDIVYFDIEQASKKSSIKPIEVDYFRSFLEQLFSRELPSILVSSAVQHGCCLLLDPFNDGSSKCSESFNLTNLTILRFVTQSAEAFFIVQQTTSADLVYFPTRRLAIVLMHASFDLLRNSLFELAKNFSGVLSYSQKASSNKFRGIVASFPRPHHFYYEIIHGVDLLNTSGLLSRIPEIIYGVGSDFYSFKDLYELSCTESTFDLKILGRENQDHNQFVIHIGIGYKPEYDEYLLEIDKLLVKHAVRTVSTELQHDILAARACFPLILLGVTIEKRAWVEQVEGLVAVIKSISQAFPGAGFVFDGWTNPLTPTLSDEKQVKEHNEVVELIKNKASSEAHTVKFFSVIGNSSAQKIPFSMAVDCFVTNSMTGALHVARFARKPGVGHNCSAMKKMMDQSILRPYIESVPDGKVTDVPNKDVLSTATSSEFVSYSIDPQDVIEALFNVVANKIISNRILESYKSNYL